ncbi:hypothetical protein ElyMa_000572600 [Elysia marginata]|uniref:Uncharacterized protein n=1 Tax=Elysia marginata TaxID=1093978 RepID=A0AAV4G3P1_9GAST|nr:hypothetical protein ElyMa_000572600 [Elysia marginata]
MQWPFLDHGQSKSMYYRNGSTRHIETSYMGKATWTAAIPIFFHHDKTSVHTVSEVTEVRAIIRTYAGTEETPFAAMVDVLLKASILQFSLVAACRARVVMSICWPWLNGAGSCTGRRLDLRLGRHRPLRRLLVGEGGQDRLF